MEGKGSFFVLLIVVAFLSLTLAMLAGYVFFFAGNGTKANVETTQSSEVKRPADDELAERSLFEGEKIYNLKSNSNDSKTMSAIKVSVVLKYYKKVKGIKNVDEKITFYESEIRELVGNYFQNMTLEEAAKTETKEKAKEELTKQINDLLMSSEKEKNDIVYTVILEGWFYQ